MSYTKSTLQDNLLLPINKIQGDTLKDNDFTFILKNLNAFMDIRERLIHSDNEVGLLWNEIIFDLLASISSATSGFYRSAIVTLRSILEIGCISIYFLDHKVEYSIFQNENSKADKYVSTLVNNYDFFKTKYIKSFYKDIVNKEKRTDAVSEYLLRKYAELSDVVHGRYSSLIKIENLSINYNKANFKRYEKLMNTTLSILSVLYILRFNDFTSDDIVDLAKISGVLV